MYQLSLQVSKLINFSSLNFIIIQLELFFEDKNNPIDTIKILRTKMINLLNLRDLIVTIRT